MTPRRCSPVILALALLVGGSASALAAEPASPRNPLLDAAEQLQRGGTPPPAPRNLQVLPPRLGRTPGPVAGPVATPALAPRLPGTPTRGTAHTVSLQGSDSTPCGQGPRRTINAGIACLRGGETLEIGEGTYDEVISTIGGPPGYSPVPVPAGTAGVPTTIKAAVPGRVRLRIDPHGGEMRFIMALEGSRADHIWIEGLVFDAEQQRRGVRGCIGIGNGTGKVTFANVQCLGADNGLVGNGRDIQVLGGHFEGMGKPGCWSSSEPPLAGYCHGAYLQTDGYTGRLLFKGVTFSGNSGYGVHSYITGITVEESVFRDQVVGGVIIVGPGGVVRNNCFETTNPTPILCNGCVDEGNRRGVAPGGCGSPSVPSSPSSSPAQLPRPAPRSLAVGAVP